MVTKSKPKTSVLFNQQLNLKVTPHSTLIIGGSHPTTPKIWSMFSCQFILDTYWTIWD